MASTITKTFKETEQSGTKATWTFTVTGVDLTVTGSTFTVPTPTVTAKYSASNKGYARAESALYLSIGGIDADTGGALYSGGRWLWTREKNASAGTPIATTSGTAYTLSKVTSGYSYGTGISHSKTVNTGTFFKASNKTSRSLTVTAYWGEFYGWSGSNTSTGNSAWGSIDGESVGNIATITLNAPPTFSSTQVSFTNDYSGVPYANLTTANVTISSLSAKYGGDISSAVLKIGSQTASRSTNGTLSIALNAVGTFVPTVTVTDSRGQTTTVTLNAITVMGYTAPTVNFDAERTSSNGAPNDEGTYAVINPKFTFTDAIATLSAPTVAVTDDEGVARTPTVTWYSTRAADGTLSGSVTWSSLSSGDTVYGLVSITNGFNTQKSYQISVTPQDSEGSGTAITQTLGSAFYTVDFYAGGHGIAFGQPASTVGFECNMSATFKDDLLLDLPEYSTSGTTDKAIYDACVALGWDSDVLVN